MYMLAHIESTDIYYIWSMLVNMNGGCRFLNLYSQNLLNVYLMPEQLVALINVGYWLLKKLNNIVQPWK